MLYFDNNVRIGRVNRFSGDIYINPAISEELRPFIIAHEYGHYIQKTSDEQLADSYAMECLAGKDHHSLKNIAKSLLILNPNNPEHNNRIIRGLNWLAWFDYLNYNNDKLKNSMPTLLDNMPRHKEVFITLFVDWLKNKGIKNVSNLSDTQKQSLIIEFMKEPNVAYLVARIDEDSNSNFLGIALSKEAREDKKARREQRQELRAEKQKARIEKQKARIDMIKAKAEGIRTGVFKPGSQAESVVSGLAPIVGPLVGTLGTALGVPISGDLVSTAMKGVGTALQGPADVAQPDPMPNAIDSMPNAIDPITSKDKIDDSGKMLNYQSQKSSSTPYIIIGVIVIVIGSIFFLKRR